MYFQRAANSVQRNVPQFQTQIPMSNQQYQSPNVKCFSIQSQAKSNQETPQGNIVKEQLDSLYLNLKKENQTLKDKFQIVSLQVAEAEKKLQQYKKA